MAGALDLINLLGGISSAKDSVSALSGKASASEDQVTQALLSALPSMLGKMQSNAKTKEVSSSSIKNFSSILSLKSVTIGFFK